MVGLQGVQDGTSIRIFRMKVDGFNAEQLLLNL